MAPVNSACQPFPLWKRQIAGSDLYGAAQTRYQGGKLRGIQDVAGPNVVQSRPANQINGFLPALQNLDHDFQPTQCFT